MPSSPAGGDVEEGVAAVYDGVGAATFDGSLESLRPRGTLAAASPLMIAHPFRPDGLGGMLSTHPPTSERVRRLEALTGGPGPSEPKAA